MNKKIFLMILMPALLVFLTACAVNNPVKEDLEWKCSLIECTDLQNMTGDEWAEQNCFDVDGEVICRLVFDNGDTYEALLNELDLSQISATKCAQFVCVEEVPFRKSDYVIEIVE